MNLQLARATIAFEPVEQNVLIGAGDPFQGLFDAPLGDRDKQPPFERRIFHSVALVTQVQC